MATSTARTGTITDAEYGFGFGECFTTEGDEGQENTKSGIVKGEGR